MKLSVESSDTTRPAHMTNKLCTSFVTFLKNFERIFFFAECRLFATNKTVEQWVANLNSAVENTTDAHAIAQYLIQPLDHGVCSSTSAVGDIVHV